MNIGIEAIFIQKRRGRGKGKGEWAKVEKESGPRSQWNAARWEISLWRGFYSRTTPATSCKAKMASSTPIAPSPDISFPVSSVSKVNPATT